MKQVLSLLLAFVFLQTQSWALSGGPVYGGGSAGVALTGVYAGVLIPNGGSDSTTTGLSPTTAAVPAAVSIGLFSLGVPETGLATGACVVFINGDAYSGTITGVADPGKGTLQAILDTQSNFIVFDPANPTIPFRIFATGGLNAVIAQLGGRNPITGASRPGSVRVRGTAQLATTLGETVTYTVDGFQQSASTSSLNTTGLGGIGGGQGTGGNNGP